MRKSVSQPNCPIGQRFVKFFSRSRSDAWEKLQAHLLVELPHLQSQKQTVPEHSVPGGAGVRGRGGSPQGARGAGAEPSGRKGWGFESVSRGTIACTLGGSSALAHLHG
jgi:hypothetical protein